MTHQERQLRQAYRDTGLGFLRIGFKEAMEIPGIRIALNLQVADRQKSNGKQAPVQPALI